MVRITYRKTRRGETIDIRADKGDDLRNVVKEMAKPASTRTLTAETITDAEIRELREQAFANGMQTTVLICRVALGEDRWDDALHGYRKPTLDEQRNCRARCAEILNARTEGK